MYCYCIKVYKNAPAMGFTGILLEPRLSNPVWQPSKNNKRNVAQADINSQLRSTLASACARLRLGTSLY